MSDKSIAHTEDHLTYGGNKWQKNWFEVPNSLLTFPNLSWQAQMTYIVLLRFLGPNPDASRAFPSYATIARLGRMSRSSAIRAVKELERNGLVQKEVRHKDASFSSNVYALIHPEEEGVGSEGHQGSVRETLPSVRETLPLVSQGHHPSVRETPYKNKIKNTNIKNNKKKDVVEDFPKTDKPQHDPSRSALGTVLQDKYQEIAQDLGIEPVFDDNDDNAAAQRLLALLPEKRRPGMALGFLQTLVKEFGEENVAEKLRLMPPSVKNPPGWLKIALEKNFVAPEPEKPPVRRVEDLPDHARRLRELRELGFGHDPEPAKKIRDLDAELAALSPTQRQQIEAQALAKFRERTRLAAPDATNPFHKVLMHGFLALAVEEMRTIPTEAV